MAAVGAVANATRPSRTHYVTFTELLGGQLRVRQYLTPCLSYSILPSNAGKFSARRALKWQTHLRIAGFEDCCALPLTSLSTSVDAVLVRKDDEAGQEASTPKVP